MPDDGPLELTIVLVIALLVLGPKRLPERATSGAGEPWVSALPRYARLAGGRLTRRPSTNRPRAVESAEI